MPAYEYTCSNCGHQEVRIAGINDHTIICDECSQVMVRQADIDSLLASYMKTAAPAKVAEQK